jgi:hypothetical protein
MAPERCGYLTLPKLPKSKERKNKPEQRKAAKKQRFRNRLLSHLTSGSSSKTTGDIAYIHFHPRVLALIVTNE